MCLSVVVIVNLSAVGNYGIPHLKGIKYVVISHLVVFLDKETIS